MSLSIYFVKPADTAIAGRNPTFITALEDTARKMPRVCVAAKPATADVVLIDERYQYRTWHYADDLSRCALVRAHADRICVINHDSYARPFLPGLYVSLEKRRPAFVDTRPIPYKWDLWKVPVPDQFVYRPNRLFTFRGTFHTHPVRKKMCKALARMPNGLCVELRKAFHTHDEADQRRHIEEIRNACFSLCPRGLSPSSYRLYESMQLGRCAVIISDDWVPPSGLEWDQLVLFVPEAAIRRLPEILDQRAVEAEQRGRLAADAWASTFAGTRRHGYLLEQVTLLHHTRQQELRYLELHRLWRSAEFRHRYDWTIRARAKQRLRRTLSAILQPQVTSQHCRRDCSPTDH